MPIGVSIPCMGACPCARLPLHRLPMLYGLSEGRKYAVASWGMAATKLARPGDIF